jgi:hypothetical protein
MALQRLAAFFQDQYFQARGTRKPVMLIGPRSGDDRCLVVGYEASQRAKVCVGGWGGGVSRMVCAGLAIGLQRSSGPLPPSHWPPPRAQGNLLGTAFIEATERVGARAWHDLFDTCVFEIDAQGGW